jgi:hypothetical protein
MLPRKPLIALASAEGRAQLGTSRLRRAAGRFKVGPRTVLVTGLKVRWPTIARTAQGSTSVSDSAADADQRAWPIAVQGSGQPAATPFGTGCSGIASTGRIPLS